ncbi:MAG: S8 family peptidase [Caldilineaceae bacterium]
MHSISGLELPSIHLDEMFMKLISKPRLISRILVTLFFTLLLTPFSSQPAAASPFFAQAITNMQTEAEIIYVQFQPDISRAAAEQAVAQMGGMLIDWLEPLHTARVQVGTTTAKTSFRRMWTLAQDEPSIQFVEPGSVIMGDAATSETTADYNDPSLAVADESYGLTRVQALDAWDAITGTQDVIIAVLDTGINPEHPEFAGRIIMGYDYINDDADPTDDHGHGSHVSGIAAAALNNGHGAAGICPNCSILAVKVLNENNAGTWWSAAQGIIYAVDNGARVINLSLGANVPSNTIKSAIDYAQENGVLIVAAAGNSASSNDFYPAAYDGILGISATNSSDELWGLSNHGAFIDVAAPGHLIYGPNKSLDDEYGGYVYKSGTSMAAPYVTGLAGLLFSQDPSRTATDVADIIMQSADDLGAPGRDDNFGHGRINVLAAINYDVETTPGTTQLPPPVANEGPVGKTGKTLYMPILVHH